MLFNDGIVLLRTVVKLPSNEQTNGSVSETWVGKSLQQQIQSFVFADESEKKDVLMVGIQLKFLNGLRFWYQRTKIIVQRMQTQLSSRIRNEGF